MIFNFSVHFMVTTFLDSTEFLMLYKPAIQVIQVLDSKFHVKYPIKQGDFDLVMIATYSLVRLFHCSTKSNQNKPLASCFSFECIWLKMF